jgi:hypothetical protein
MNIKKYIKTQCGIEKYYMLKIKSENSLPWKVRLYIFITIATIRDLFR